MKKIENITYEIDPYNRLIVKGKINGLARYRKVVAGRFVSSGKNSLTYQVNKSEGIDTPQQIKLNGNWSLDKNYDLVFSLNKWNNDAEANRLTIKGDIIDASASELSFSITTLNPKNNPEIYTLKLSGIWKADDYNRISFYIERASGLNDKFIFKGAWEVNKYNEVIYIYEKASLKKKEKISNTITFKGYWDITDKQRISYILDKEIGSEFRFKVGLGSVVKNNIQYKIDLGVIPRKKNITLSGEWRLDKKLGVLFEIEYEDKSVCSVAFGANLSLGKNYTVNARLKNKSGDDLGLEVQLSRSIFKGAGEAFIKAASNGEEKAIFAGTGFRW